MVLKISYWTITNVHLNINVGADICQTFPVDLHQVCIVAANLVHFSVQIFLRTQMF